MGLKKSIEIDLDFTPEDIAELFCCMDHEKQATFFNTIAKITSAKGWNLPMQLSYVSESELLSKDGRNIMRLIGMYGDH